MILIGSFSLYRSIYSCFPLGVLGTCGCYTICNPPIFILGVSVELNWDLFFKFEAFWGSSGAKWKGSFLQVLTQECGFFWVCR